MKTRKSRWSFLTFLVMFVSMFLSCGATCAEFVNEHSGRLSRWGRWTDLSDISIIEQRVFNTLESVAGSVKENGKLVLRDFTSGFSRQRGEALFELEFDWVHKGRRETYQCREQNHIPEPTALAATWQALFNRCITQAYDFFDLPLDQAALYTKAPTLVVAETFDLGETTKLMAPGTGSVQGRASIIRADGAVMYCTQDSGATLLPATKYASERMRALYTSADSGFNPTGMRSRRFSFTNTPTEYLQLQQKVKCGPSGSFAFEQLADGDFYVLATVLWKNKNQSQDGGVLMKRISIRSGEITKVALSHDAEK